MDVSGAKCGSSDFSIERILRDDKREEAAPSWLCCTRYQPPRIPRPANSNGCRARRSGRHARVPFTAAQAAALEAAYARAPYLAPPALRALAAALQLRDDRIKIWFQNRRARERREKCASITPPHSTPLPPTTVPQVLISPAAWIPHVPHIKIEQNIQCKESYNGSGTESSNLQSSTSTETDQNTMFMGSSTENLFLETRPDTPLDIETVED